ncbi:MAG: type I secretion system permease/ATPase [Pseudomonadota bacterium]
MAQTKQATPSINVSERLAAARRLYGSLAVFSLFASLLMLTGPIYMLQVYDRVLASGSVPTLLALTGLVALLYTSLAILDWIRGAILTAVASRVEDALGDDALRAAVEARLKDAGQAADGPLRDLRTIRKFLSGPVLKSVFDAPFSIIFFVILFLIHWLFGVLAIGGAIVLTLIAFLNQRLSNKATLEAERLEQASNLRAREMMRNAEVIEALGLRPQLQAKWRAQLDQSDTAMANSSNLVSGFTNGTKSFRMFLQSGVLGLGAYLTIIAQSTAGAMIAASIITGRAIAPLEQLVGQWRSVVLAREAWANLKATLEALPVPTEGLQLPPIEGRVSFENVSAAHPGATKAFLKNISFELDAGDVLGVIGPSAAGKSTLARLIIGVWQPQMGVVRIDGADLTSRPRELLGPQLGYLPQQVDLFAGTIRDNICRFIPDAEDQEVIEAAVAADCHEMVLRLPDGYDTEIGENGAYLSAGQRQRLGFARALFRNPSLVVLDEPNSNLDNQGDNAFLNAVAGLKSRSSTVVIVAHRPNAIAHCNKLLMLDDGNMRAFGPREEVLKDVAPKQAGGRVQSIGKGSGNG